MTFGEKLLKLRKSRNMSQEQLADRMCVTRQAVSRWELDETLPDSENVLKIADMFYVSAEYLLNDSVDIDDTKRYIPLYADKYDTVNLLGALSSVFVSVMAFLNYGRRWCWDYRHYRKLSPQRTSHAIYYDVRYYAILDETVILAFLAVVITVSAIMAYRLYKKCNFQNKLNKNSK